MTGAVVAGLVAAALLWPPRAQRHRPQLRAAREEQAGPAGHGRHGSRQAGVEAVADALVLVALALRAGLPVVEALEQAACCAHGQVAADLSSVAAALRWGRPVPVAWSYAGPMWRPAALAFQMADATGAGPADLVDAAAARLREAQERDRERRAARAGVLLVLPLGLGFLPAFACTAVVPLVVVLAGGLTGG